MVKGCDGSRCGQCGKVEPDQVEGVVVRDGTSEQSSGSIGSVPATVSVADR